MLSTEYTTDEVKKELEDYSFYGYSSDTKFTEDIVTALNKVKYEILWGAISSVYEGGEIQTISTAASDREDFLTNIFADTEAYRYIFFAEVYFAVATFLKRQIETGFSSDKDKGLKSFSIEGYSQGEASREWGPDSIRKIKTNYYGQGRKAMIQAGYEFEYRIYRV